MMSATLPLVVTLSYGAGALAWFGDYVRRVRRGAKPDEIRRTIAAGAALYCALLASALTLLFISFISIPRIQSS